MIGRGEHCFKTHVRAWVWLWETNEPNSDFMEHLSNIIKANFKAVLQRKMTKILPTLLISKL